jgi:hypothetical protein
MRMSVQLAGPIWGRNRRLLAQRRAAYLLGLLHNPAAVEALRGRLAAEEA